MEEQIERWELRSGTWVRDRASERWCLAATWDGTVVDPRLPVLDVVRLAGARRATDGDEWFPPEFNYSQQTGAPLRVTNPALDSPLALARAHERSASGQPDRTLPPLPPGHYRFVVDKFDAAWPTLVAVEPEQGKLLALLPESEIWMPLKRTAGTSWGRRLANPRGWRMELVHAGGHATGYCPSATGLAAVTPSAIGLCYAIEHAGEGPAIGGPVAWEGEIWSPVLGKGHRIHLIGKPHGAPEHLVLPTHAPVPQDGFEAPVSDDAHVNWPCDEGQLVLRLDAQGGRQCEWVAWPERVKPMFSMGSFFVPGTGTFWQVCRSNVDGRFEYVEMARAEPEIVSIDGPRLCMGRACYRGTSRIDIDPLRPVDKSTDIVAPLLDLAGDGAVVGLRMDAPHGVLALLHADNEPRRAVLQLEVPGRAAVPFGTLDVKKPWSAQLFVYDGHLWVDHPDLPQAVGWQLAPANR